MGADLFIALTEIDKDKEPDWRAAERFLKKLPPKKAIKAYNTVTGFWTPKYQSQSHVGDSRRLSKPRRLGGSTVYDASYALRDVTP